MTTIPLDSYTEAFASLKSTGQSIDSEEWSELDTRSKLIDAVLIDCLGWSESDIRRELSLDKHRLDYRLSTAIPKLVLEAKRTGVQLATTCRTSPNRLKIRSLLASSPARTEPIEQLAAYCHTYSIPIGVLTNGRTYMFIQAIRLDAVPWRDGWALVINDIFAPAFPFKALNDLLSRRAAESGAILTALRIDTQQSRSRSVLAGYEQPNALQEPNELALHIERVLQRVFTDLVDESPEILKNCYVTPAETTLRNDAIEFPLLDRPESDDLHICSVENLWAFKQFEKTISANLTQHLGGSTLLVIGNIGVGNTMFLRRFFRTNCNPDHLPEHVLPFFIDYRASTLDPTKALEDAYSRLRSHLETLDTLTHDGDNSTSDHPPVDVSSENALTIMYHAELSRFERLSRGELREAEFDAIRRSELIRLKEDNRKFVIAAFRYLREHCNLRPCIILDNADHHDSDFQSKIYLAAKTLHQELRTLVLLSLQETWYWHFRQGSGVLSYYQDLVFHIPAPRARDVIAKRLDYAITIANQLFKGISVPLANNVSLEPAHLARFLEVCKTTLFNNNEIAMFFEAMANNNVRKGLELFCMLMRSGHTSTRRYLHSVTVGSPQCFSLGPEQA